MKRTKALVASVAALSALAVALTVGTSIGVAAVPDVIGDQAMYATDYTAGGPESVAVTLDPYTPPNHAMRLNPANALGPFDAAPGTTGVNDYFFAVASQTSTDFAFADKFCNVSDGWATDVEFAEVTWSAWHVEAAKVYLTGAVVNGAAYGTADEGIGYYAGIVWNKVGILGIDAATRDTIAQSYVPAGVTRVFPANEYKTVGNYGVSGFNLPDEVDSATDVTLVDITEDVYDTNTIQTSLFAPSSFVNVGGTGMLVRATSLDPFTFETLGVAQGNTDGYDLDAIRVWKCAPDEASDTATGVGQRILKKGTWFMFNTYSDPDPATAGDDRCWDVQAGNPLDGIRIIGEYCIDDLGGGQYVATYDLDPTINLNGWTYAIDVTAEHLAVSDDTFTTANPGGLDNQDFGVPFSDADGGFYVFASFGIDYN